MGEPEDALRRLATRLREEDTPISPYIVEPPPGEPTLGRLGATGGRTAAAAGARSLVVESIREGYLLHYAEPRLLAGHDADLALLAGDYLYALGLERLAALGDTEAVLVLADLIAACARAHTEGREDEVPDLWRSAVAAIRSD